MNDTEGNYVVFFVSGRVPERFALELGLVDRIVQLPELTSIPSGPPYMAGVLDLAGTLVPVLDFRAILNRPRQRYALTDVVIVLHGSGTPFGILVGGVTDTNARPQSGIRELLPALGGEVSHGIINGSLRLEGEVVFLPDDHALSQYGEGVKALLDWSQDKSASGTPAVDLGEGSFHGNILQSDLAAFRKRARCLMNDLHDGGEPAASSFAVVGLCGESFGIPLEQIREFCDIRGIAPVPCCPEHIAGSMNLRGEVLTVVDIRPVLCMKAPTLARLKKAVVLDLDGIVFGMGVEEIHDLINVSPDRIARLPLAINSAAGKGLKGTATAGGRTVTILDPAALLLGGALVVNEEL